MAELLSFRELSLAPPQPLFGALHQSSLLQSDHRLVCCNSQHDGFKLCRKISPLGSCHQSPDFVLESQPERRNRDLSCSDRIRCHGRLRSQIAVQPGLERATVAQLSIRIVR